MENIHDFGYHILIRILLLKNNKFEHRKTTRVYIQENFLCYVSTKLSKHKTFILDEEKPSKFSNMNADATNNFKLFSI